MKKNYRLIINPFAEFDLLSGFEFYELQKNGLGKLFINEVDHVLERIVNNPFQFYQEKRNVRKAIVDKFPFGIFFYIKGDLINVFAVFHFSRNPKNLRGRIRKH
jgi:toxin ParE1/3/4